MSYRRCGRVQWNNIRNIIKHYDKRMTSVRRDLELPRLHVEYLKYYYAEKGSEEEFMDKHLRRSCLPITVLDFIFGRKSSDDSHTYDKYYFLKKRLQRLEDDKKKWIKCYSQRFECHHKNHIESWQALQRLNIGHTLKGGYFIKKPASSCFHLRPSCCRPKKEVGFKTISRPETKPRKRHPPHEDTIITKVIRGIERVIRAIE
ncbi:uncharacterized protein KY384_003343 [Bacidia gigantensis]|uniref:uncharacterized protein n=1 Tax=Bacidia gigantensis TaxID=2732470 RepID=UPI001D0540DE|nr:uncharacterized protein KY384_003343 [Bacidia gigantensis]KAG8531711.1 hypothetical protein KY384_003343 [Bacidia gigantensis]